MVKRLFFCLFMWGMCSGLSAQILEGPLPFFRSFLDGNLTKITFPEPNEPGASGWDSKGNYKRKNRAAESVWGLQLTEGKEEIGAFYFLHGRRVVDRVRVYYDVHERGRGRCYRWYLYVSCRCDHE